MDLTWLWVVISLIGLVLLGLLLKLILNGPKTKLNRDLSNQLIIITGCTSGIGVETAKECLKRGAKVIFACRNKEKTIETINKIKDSEERSRAIFIKFELSSFRSVFEFVEEIKANYTQIDILINNAGAVIQHFGLTEDQIEFTLQTNHFSHMLLTMMLLPMISNQGRIINVSSEANRMVKNLNIDQLNSDLGFESYRTNYGMFQMYAHSKLANIYFTQQLDRFLKHKEMNIKTASLHPGVIKTSLGQNVNNCCLKFLVYLLLPLAWPFIKTPFVGAQTTLNLVYIEYEKLNSGAYYKDCKEAKLMAHAISEQNMQKYMLFSKNVLLKNLQSTPEEVTTYLDEIA